MDLGKDDRISRRDVLGKSAATFGAGVVGSSLISGSVTAADSANTDVTK